MNEVSQAIRGARSALVAAHLSPDVDAAGSLLAVGYILAYLQVNSMLLLEDGMPYEGRYLPGADRVVREAEGDFDLAIILDCSDLSRIGRAAECAGKLPVVNIDHHVTNSCFGTYNLVDPEMASTTQLVLRLAASMGVPLSPELSTCVLAGLVGDTQGFHTPNTDERALRDACLLMEAGADLWQANREIFQRRPRSHLTLWGSVLAKAVREDGLVWATIPLPLRRRAGVADEDDAGIVNFLMSTEGTIAAALFSERKDGTVNVNLRSLPGVDVAAIAVAFGGGGHRQAAGCTVAGSLASVSAAVLARLREELGGATVRVAAARQTGRP